MVMAEIDQIFEGVRRDGRTKLTEFEAKQVLAAAGIAGTREELATSEQTAVSSAQKLGYPVVLKISSPDVLHKTDAGGVKVGLANDEAVGQAYQEIMNAINEKHPAAKIDGVLVQEMVEQAVTAQLLEIYTRNFNVYVDAIKQGSGDALLVFGYQGRRTGTWL